MRSLKVLFVGNSFAVDTMEHAANVALSLGVERVRLGVLYVGGCPIEKHYEHAVGDMPVYVYHVNEGEGWSSREGVSISEAIAEDTWDWIAIQHGTSGTARYTSAECYEKLTPLISYIKERANSDARIAFNLTWMGESTRQHHEIISYGGDISLMRKMLERVTSEAVLTCPLLDKLTPTGTAIENARTSNIGLLTRDCFHLSVDKGRYIAALTFICSITGLCPDGISWAPVGVDEYARAVAVESAKNAIERPLEITRSVL